MIPIGGLVFFTGVMVLVLIFVPNSDLTQGEKKVAIIHRGMNVHEIAGLLQRQKIIKHGWSFVYAARLLGVSDRLKAGRYEFSGEKSNRDFLQVLREGRVSHVRVTIPEGLPSCQIVSILAHKLGVDSLRLVGLIHDSAFVRSLDVPAPTLEGFLFPDTYFFYWGDDERNLLRTFVAHFFEVVNDSLQRRIQEKGMNLLQVVTLASLIQGEAMVEEEMRTISAVYHNRLQRNMLLQADPTLQFIISDGPRRLTNQDKQIDSPYNTYLYPGLPPGPINNPGESAIRAAMNPADVPYLYFVANGDGTHTFSKTLQEHLRAKSRFDKIRRAYYRKEKGKGGR